MVVFLLVARKRQIFFDVDDEFLDVKFALQLELCDLVSINQGKEGHNILVLLHHFEDMPNEQAGSHRDEHKLGVEVDCNKEPGFGEVNEHEKGIFCWKFEACSSNVAMDVVDKSIEVGWYIGYLRRVYEYNRRSILERYDALHGGCHRVYNVRVIELYLASGHKIRAIIELKALVKVDLAISEVFLCQCTDQLALFDIAYQFCNLVSEIVLSVISSVCEQIGVEVATRLWIFT